MDLQNMKNIRLFLTVTLLMVVTIVMAVPADPTPVTVSQPDGSNVTLVLRGDEWLHFITTVDGYTVMKNSDGYYVYAVLGKEGLTPSKTIAHDADNRSGDEWSFLAGITKYQVPKMSEETVQQRKEENRRRQAKLYAARRDAKHTYENFRGLVILVEFNDMSFSRDDFKELITDMINKKDYTGFDSEVFTGSLRDYFYDNSNGKFEPQFDIAGPYQIDYSQYDGGARATMIMRAVVDSADVDVNFQDYDSDGDGVVDVVYFLFAGYDASYFGNDNRLLWPHESYLYDYVDNHRVTIVKDGVGLSTYACSTELYGWQDNPNTVKINGIGTMCHEFSHALGLPDFYDTGYTHSYHPGDWSVMANGGSRNYGRTPVGYSLYERWALGFCDEPETISKDDDYTLPPLYQEQKGYRINTPNENEFFLLENRQQKLFKWDKKLPGSGMLVFRVDRSDLNPWNINTVNNDSTHLCYELLRANGWQNYDSNYDAFPSKDKTSLSSYTSPANLKTWDGKDNDLAINDIQMNGNLITFHLTDLTVDAIPTISLGDEDTPSGNVYNLNGQRVTDNYKGIIIAGGKKMIRK